MNDLLEVRCEVTECARNKDHKCTGYFGVLEIDENGECMGFVEKEEENCTDCILDGTDACSRGAGRAVDDSICKDFITEKEDKHERQQTNQ